MRRRKHYIIGTARTAERLARANGLGPNEYLLIQLPQHVEGLRFEEGDTLTDVRTPGDWKAISPDVYRQLDWVIFKSGFRPPSLCFPD